MLSILLCLFAQMPLEIDSMLFQANELSERYDSLVAKAPPPSQKPQTDALLQLASNWFSIDLTHLKAEERSPLASLNQALLWDALASIGIDAVELQGLTRGEAPAVRLQIDPKCGSEEEYAALMTLVKQKGIVSIGSLLGASTGKGADFALALKNVGAYPSLYSLIEIRPEDWHLLPKVATRSLIANIHWSELQALRKKGYVPVGANRWDATDKIYCADQKIRRWIFLRDEQGFPQLDWLQTTCASVRLAAASALYGMFHLAQPILQCSAELPSNAQETLSLLVRRLGGFSAAFANGGVRALKSAPSDAVYDHLTPMASLHALIAEDAEALKLLYRLLLKEEIPLKRLIHSLEPFGRFPCDWAEFLQSPAKQYQYREETLTGEALRSRLIQQDRYLLEGALPSNWTSVLCSMLKIEDLEKHRELILSLHTLLAKLFAWQPGPFSLAATDLLGSGPLQTSLDLSGKNSESLYSSIESQLQTPHSFASRLKEILQVRRAFDIDKADLIDVPISENKSVLLLRYATKRGAMLLAVNFGRIDVAETLESPDYVRTNAIDASLGLTERKLYDSSFFVCKLKPLSAKLILFNAKQ